MTVARSVRPKMIFKNNQKLIFFLFLAVMLFHTILAHSELEEKPAEKTVSDIDVGDPVFHIKITIIIVVLTTLVALTFGKKYAEKNKRTFFVIMVAPVLLSSLYLGGHTVYKNFTSETKGPVHWHADYQVWVCGERIDLVDPKFPSNKIGSPLFHEHNDDRIHVEGTVMDIQSIDLASYFRVIGGELEAGHLRYPGKDKEYN